MFNEGYHDRWTEFHDGLAYDVYVYPDNSYSPNEYTTPDEDPELFEAYHNGDMRYVGVKVSPAVADSFVASLWGIAYGTCKGWENVVDRDYLKKHYLPDLIAEILAEVRLSADGLRNLIKTAERAA